MQHELDRLSKSFLRVGHALAVAMLVFAVITAGQAAAAEKPKPCRMLTVILPVGIGTGSDLIFRAFADAINSSNRKTRVRVVNRVREETVRTVADNVMDGCTLLGITQEIVATYMTEERELTWRDFKPAALLTRTNLSLVTSPGYEPANLAGVLEKLKEKPRSVSIAYTVDSLDQMFLWQLVHATGLEFKTVRYNSGHRRLMAVLNREMDVTLASVNTARNRREDGVRVLAVTDEGRVSDLGDIPTLGEQGVDLAFGVDRMLLAPKSTSDAALKLQVALFEKATTDRQLRKILRGYDTRIRFLGSFALARYLEDLSADWRDMLTALEMHPPPLPEGAER